METTNLQLSVEINSNLLLLNDKLKDGLNEFNSYLEVFKDEQYNENLSETEEVAIKKAEGIPGRVDKLILQYPKKHNQLKGCIEDIKDEWNEHRINIEKILTKKQEKRIKKMNGVITINEMKQIEEWTKMKVGNIIFDSDIDNWNFNTSVFGQKIINKSNLVFLIEDEVGNKFGGYINVIIDDVGIWINDPKSFLFSLKSNGRLNGMVKFDIVDSQHTLMLGNQYENCLFLFGYGKWNDRDICIWKENKKNDSYCYQTSFNYNGIENALCGKIRFTPKRITIIQKE